MKKVLQCLAIIYLLFHSFNGNSQSIDLNLTQDNILNETEYFATLNSGYLFMGGLGWRRTTINRFVMLRSTNQNFIHNNGIYSLPTSLVNFQLSSIAGYSPGSSGLSTQWPIPERFITTSFQSFLQPLYAGSRAYSGDIMINYRIAANSFVSNMFIAGTYSADIVHNQPHSLIYNDIEPSGGGKMNINVPAFTVWNSSTLNYSVALNAENFTGTDYEITLNNLEIGHTVPSFVEIKGQAPITFTPAGGGVTSTRPLSALQITSNNTVFSTKTLTNAYQALNSTALPVAAGNKTSVPLKIKILSAELASNFFEAGTYTFNLDVRTRSNDNSVADVKTIAVTIVTNAISYIRLKDENQSVVFNFLTSADYQTGKSVNMPGHINITNNKPFQVYVKSSGNYFTLNSTPTSIPVSIVTVENGTGETQVISKPLSATSQNIIRNATPVLNKQLSIKYTIPPSQTGILFNKPTGVTYLTNVIYSFTNL